MLPPESTGSPPAVRRAPYGANPELGRHGSRARLEILDAARTLFAEHGYHGTTVEAIGAAAGRSGASVYQYFEGKGQIFRVFVDELGTDVLAQARRLGELERLRPGAEALDELTTRVAALSDVLGRHSTTFALWVVAEEAEPALRGSFLRFVDAFADAVRPGFAAAGIPEPLQRPLAITVGATVQWAQSTRTARTPELPAAVLHDVLARVVYQALFPADRGTAEPPEPAIPAVERPAAARRPADPGTLPGVRRRVSPRSRATLERITSAATVAFRRNGFHGTSVNDIAAAAEVSHGSVYTYWPDRSGLFTTLAHEAAIALGDHFEGSGCALSTEADGRAWLASWLGVVAAHGAVLHIWTHEVLEDERLGPLAREMAAYVYAWFDAVLHSSPVAGRIDPVAANLVLWSLLTDVPYTLGEQAGVVSRAELLDSIALLLRHGLLGYR
jgi:AcrR family transcriptional regulator